MWKYTLIEKSIQTSFLSENCRCKLTDSLTQGKENNQIDFLIQLILYLKKHMHGTIIPSSHFG